MKRHSDGNSARMQPSSVVRNCRVQRAGLTLLEILLSLAIFFGALAMLAQISWNGARAAIQARLKTQAIIRCEAKLAEVLSGYEKMQQRSGVQFPDNPSWTWSLTISDTTFPDLLQLDVMVSHSGNNRLGHAEFNLRRWMRDPGVFQSAATKKKESQSINGKSSSTSTSSSK